MSPVRNTPSPSTQNPKNSLISLPVRRLPSVSQSLRNPKQEIQTQDRGNIRPFPMSKEMLQSVSGEGPPRKRLSDGVDSGERKKRKEGDDNFDVDTSFGDDGEDELVFLDPGINPKDLCPYCDTLLPPNPTPFLLSLLATAESASIPDARPTNPLGRKATMMVYVGLCQRHRFESMLLPKARRKGWKEVIEWGGLTSRIEAMKDVLVGILVDVDDGGYGGEGEQVQDEDSDDDDEEEKERERMQDKKDMQAGKGPRNRCIFWKELMKEVKQTGTKRVVGVSGQANTFEKFQPGYYGEQGSTIIQQTLYTLFPPASISHKLTHPITPLEFHQRIFVPQVSLLLIRDDLNSSIKKALKTMRDSASYGVSMFPADDDGDEWEGGQLREDKMSIADKIVLERARKRREELEVEERDKNEAFAKQLAEAEQIAEQGKGKEPVKGKGKVGKPNNILALRRKLSPVAKAIVVHTEADPFLKKGLGSIICAKGRKVTDSQTIGSYRFAVAFVERWFKNKIKVAGGKCALVRKRHILEVLDYTPAWYTQAHQLVQLLDSLSQHQIQQLKLEESSLGGRKLHRMLKLKTSKTSRM